MEEWLSHLLCHPFGNKQTRRAIQIGMKGEVLEEFGRRYIKKLEDLTDYVKEQRIHVDNKKLDKLHVPIETIYKPGDESLCNQIGVD